MNLLQPFRALLADPKHVEEVSCVNYDVVSRAEARALAGKSKNSFLRVVRSDIEFSDSDEPAKEELARRSRKNFDELIERNIFSQDSKECFYVYRQRWRGHTQTGLVACTPVSAYEDGSLRRHEKTREDKENEVTEHLIGTGAHTSPVFVIYRNHPALEPSLDEVTNQPPLYDFSCEEEIQHQFWRVEDGNEIAKKAAQIEMLYIADGHHRAASAMRTAKQMGKSKDSDIDLEEAKRMMVVAFPEKETNILPYHRVIKNIPTENLLQQLREITKVEKSEQKDPDEKGVCCLYVNGQWYQVLLPQASTSDDPAAALDVSRLYDHILKPLLGIGDPRTDKNLDFVGGIRGLGELKRLVDSGEATAAFAMYPTSPAELLDISDKNLIMAPKSTWFEPKIRNGLFIHLFRAIRT